MINMNKLVIEELLYLVEKTNKLINNKKEDKKVKIENEKIK